MHSNDKRRLKDVTTGLCVISAICGLVNLAIIPLLFGDKRQA